jgi:uncharacterized protein
LLIQTDRLKNGPLQLEVNEAASGFPALCELLSQGEIEVAGTIEGSVRVFRAARIVEADGSLSAKLVSPCGRCLAPVVTPLTVDFSLSYTENGEAAAKDDAEEVELTEDDLGLIPFDGQEIDLRSDLDQELVMALPQQLLCSDKCKGLCHQCGVNLNKDKCSCEPPVFHPGLAALKNIKIDE